MISFQHKSLATYQAIALRLWDSMAKASRRTVLHLVVAKISNLMTCEF